MHSPTQRARCWRSIIDTFLMFIDVLNEVRADMHVIVVLMSVPYAWHGKHVYEIADVNVDKECMGRQLYGYAACGLSVLFNMFD